MHNVREPAAMERLVDENRLPGSLANRASIVGNLALVVPSMLLHAFLILWWTGHEIIPPEKAVKVMDSISISLA